MSLTRSPLLAFAGAVAVAATLVPAAAQAQVQERPQVRVAGGDAPIFAARRPGSPLVTTVSDGGTYDVIVMSGDPYAHQDSNWYLVQLPADAFGRMHMGWVSGAYVRELPRPQMQARTQAPEPIMRILSSRPSGERGASMAVPDAGFVSGAGAAAAPAAAAEPANIPDVTVHFGFDKSDLTLDARTTLDCAMEMLADGQGMAFAVEGHADSTGPDGYNEKLGLARAEAVRSYLIEQHHVAADQISVVSMGERDPAASNDTTTGRAMNRRVVVKVGG